MQPHHKPSAFALGLLFFLQWAAIALWNISFSGVLRAHGLEAYIPYAFACSGVAAFISPLYIGALADHSVSPVRLLAWLNFASGALIALCFSSIDLHWGGGMMLGFMMAYSLCASPLFSLSTAVALSILDNPAQRFGIIRLWATFGWACSGWFVSLILHADTSTRSGYAASLAFVALGFYCLRLPPMPPTPRPGPVSWKERLGLDALSLLGHPDHRMVFLTTTLLTIPLAAFYPITPLHLLDLGTGRPAAYMALGQITEVLCLVAMGGIWKRVRLKWIFVAGLIAAILRYALFSLDTMPTVVLGITLHGVSYALYYITAQIYLAERIEPGMKVRAQALLTLLISGVGNLSGYLLSGWLRNACAQDGHTQWSMYWWILCTCTSATAIGFILLYRGLGRRPEKAA